MKQLASFLFENSPWDPYWSALFVGFAAIGLDGRLYLTDHGQEYLDGVTE